VVDEVLEAHSAGSPTDEAVRWTDLKPVQLAQQVLAQAGYRRRSLRKALISGDVEPHERDRQFRLIATLRRKPVPVAYRCCVSIPGRKRGWATCLVAGPVTAPMFSSFMTTIIAISLRVSWSLIPIDFCLKLFIHRYNIELLPIVG